MFEESQDLTFGWKVCKARKEAMMSESIPSVSDRLSCDDSGFNTHDDASNG